MKCPSCGANRSPDSATCTYCGSQQPVSTEAEEPAVFMRIKMSNEYAGRNSPERHARLPKYGTVHKAFLNIFFVIFIGGAAMMCVIALSMAGVFGVLGFRAGDGFGALLGIVPLLFAMVPLGFVVLGILMWKKMKDKMGAVQHDPVQAIPVVVVDKRTQVSGGSGSSSASTYYFVTCEGEDGSRQEYQVWDGRLYGRIVAGDAGVLFVRAGYGLDFDQVSV